MPSVLEKNVSDQELGLLVYQLNRLSYEITTTDLDIDNVAPAMIVTAGFDPLRDGGKAYAEQFVRNGVFTRYRNYNDMVHRFMTFRDVDRTREAIREVGTDLAEIHIED